MVNLSPSRLQFILLTVQSFKSKPCKPGGMINVDTIDFHQQSEWPKNNKFCTVHRRLLQKWVQGGKKSIRTKSNTFGLASTIYWIICKALCYTSHTLFQLFLMEALWGRYRKYNSFRKISCLPLITLQGRSQSIIWSNLSHIPVQLDRDKTHLHVWKIHVFQEK